MPDETCIYALSDPRDNRIWYVGKAKDPTRRLRWHMRGCESAPRKETWIRSLREAGLVAEVHILDRAPVDDWRAAESRWIAHYREVNPGLTNATPEEQQNYARQWPRKTIPDDPPETPSTMSGEELRAYRKARGWQQKQLARALGTHDSAVSLWETGKRRIPRVVRLALESLGYDE